MGYYVNWLLDNDLNEQEIKRLSENTGILEEDVHLELLNGDFQSKTQRLINGVESFSKEFPDKEYLLYGTGEDGDKFKYKIKNGETTSYKPIINWQEYGLSTADMDREDVVNELADDYSDVIDITELMVSETTDLRELLHNLRNKN